MARKKTTASTVGGFGSGKIGFGGAEGGLTSSKGGGAESRQGWSLGMAPAARRGEMGSSVGMAG